MCKVDQIFSFCININFYTLDDILWTQLIHNMQLRPCKFFFFQKNPVPTQHKGSETEPLVKDDHPLALQNDNNLVCLALFCDLTQLLCITSA